MIDTEYVEQFRKTGREYGYKACCIEFFCSEWFDLITARHTALVLGEVYPIGSVYSGLARWAGGKAGFIPCPECLAKLLRKTTKRKKR